MKSTLGFQSIIFGIVYGKKTTTTARPRRTLRSTVHAPSTGEDTRTQDPPIYQFTARAEQTLGSVRTPNRTEITENWSFIFLESEPNRTYVSNRTEILPPSLFICPFWKEKLVPIYLSTFELKTCPYLSVHLYNQSKKFHFPLICVFNVTDKHVSLMPITHLKIWRVFDFVLLAINIATIAHWFIKFILDNGVIPPVFFYN